MHGEKWVSMSHYYFVSSLIFLLPLLFLSQILHFLETPTLACYFYVAWVTAELLDAKDSVVKACLQSEITHRNIPHTIRKEVDCCSRFDTIAKVSCLTR